MSYTSRHKGSVIDDAVDQAHNPAEVAQGDGIVVSKTTVSGTDTFTVSVDGSVAKKSDLPSVPTKVSQLTNDSGYQNSSDVSSVVTGAIGNLDVAQVGGMGKYIQSISENDGKISATAANMPLVPNKTSQLTNDSGFITEHQSLTAYAKKSELPTKTSDLTNDSNFQTSSQVSSAITSAIGGLNKSGSPSTNQYISIVRQSAGIIECQKATLPMHTAGNGISVSSGTVSAKLGSGLSFDANGAIQATGGGSVDAVWGGITGTLANQTDLKTALDSKANAGDIPSNVSDLVNDSNFQTSAQVSSTVNSAIDALDVAAVGGNGKYIKSISETNGKISAVVDTMPTIPTNVSDLTNDSGFQTSAQVSSAISSAINALDVASVGGAGKYISAISEDNGKISATASTFPAIPTVPTAVSAFTNDSGYQTSAQVSAAITTAINGLDKADTAVAGQYVSAVKEENGVITVSRANLPTTTYKAGTNITIASDGTISAKDTTYKAGANITISDEGYISASGELSSTEWGNIAGNLSSQSDLKEALDSKASVGDIPTKVSDLTNDSNFQTSTQVSTAITNAVNGLDATSVGGAGKYIQSISETNGVISATAANMPSVPTKTSDLTNDSGFLTEHQSLTAYAKKSELPTKTSDLTNDSGFLTSHQSLTEYAKKSELPGAVSELTNDSGYQTSAQVTSAISTAVGALDVTDAAVAGKYVSAVSETDGKITVTRTNLPTVPTKVSDLTNDSGYQTSAQVTSAVSTAVNALDVTDTAVAGKYVSAVSESDGKITVTRANLPTVPAKVSDLTNDSGFQTSSDVNEAIDDALGELSASPSSTSWVTGITQTNGKITNITTGTVGVLSTFEGNFADTSLLVAATGPYTSTPVKLKGSQLWSWISGKLPSIPTKVSDLTNDSGFQDSADVSSAITSALDTLDADASDNAWISGITQTNGKITSIYFGAPENLGNFSGSFSDNSLLVAGDGVSPYKPKKITGSSLWSWISGKLPAIPTKVSDLTNDAKYIKLTDEDLPVTYDGKCNINGRYEAITDASASSLWSAGDLKNEYSEKKASSYLLTVRGFNAFLDDLGGIPTKAEVAAKQDQLIAGSGITIAADGKTISSTSAPAATSWGSITGTLSNQTDLKDALDGKADTFTTNGDVITFEDGVIDLTQDVKEAFYMAQLTHLVTGGSGITVTEDPSPATGVPTYIISATGGSSSYSPGNRVVITSTSQFSSLTANTCYEINRDFSMSGTYTIPEGVSFFFAGGSISGGTWNCPGDADYTAYWRDRSKRPRLLGDVKFNKSNYSMVWNGGFANDEIDFEWFNPSHSNSSNSNADLVAALVGQLHDQVLNIGDMYPITKPITITTGSATIQSKNQFQGGYAAFTASCSAGFYIVGKLFSAIVLSDGRINLKGITLLGATGFTDKNRSTPWALYGSRNAHNDNTAINVTLYDRYFKSYTLNSGASGSEYPNSANFCGLDLQHGSVELVEDCCFNGFCRGISLDATKTWSSGTPGFFNRCFISTCKWGVFVANTSDFFFTNCKINSCNSDCATGLSGSTGRNIKAQGQYNTSTHRHEDYGGGVYISASNMIQFDACRWEFNYMGIYLDNACSNINFTGGIFDRCTHSVMTIYNAADHYITSDQFPDRHNPAVCGVNFTGNNILRGIGSRTDWESSSPSLTPGVAYFCVCSRPDSSTDAWVTRTDGLRKLDLHIAANTFEDNMEMAFDGVSSHTGAFNPQNLTYEKSIFMFDCTDNGGVDINFSGNDFSASKATYFSESYNSSSSAGKGYATIKGGNNTYPTDMDFSVPYYHSTDARKNAQVARLNEIAFEDGSIVTYDTTLGGGKRPLRWKGTLAQYNALATHYDDTDYLITE